MIQIELTSLNELGSVARKVSNSIQGKKIVCFYGEMGAGKTTLIKAICEVLGVKDNVASPTFALINEYKSGTGESIYHFDFYRINKIEEVYDFGYEEYFYNSKGVCFIEWPELIEEILPVDVCRIRIKVNPNNSRTLLIE